ncbi:hypothetical protein DFH27DRAFT_268222 [Peziza echinospora]|nr:hypothetical protein DFH27DRAFT_268222 [Peziza echinospora]
MEDNPEGWSTPPLLSPFQPPPPPPTPVAFAATPGTLGRGREEHLFRQTSIGFGSAEPQRHRYGSLSSAAIGDGTSGGGDTGGGSYPDEMDIDGPEEDDAGEADAGEAGEAEEDEAVIARSGSKQHAQPSGFSKPRVLPRRLSIKTGSPLHRIPTWYPRTPAPYHSAHPQAQASSGLLSPSLSRNHPELFTNERFFRTWELTYRFDQSRSGINSAFALVVFLGGPPPPSPPVPGAFEDPQQRDRELAEWVKSIEGLRVGGHGVSGASGSSADGPATQQTVSGAIPLTKALIERIAEVGGSLEPETVAPYLRDRLHWVVERADGGIVHLPTLKARVASYLTDMADQEPTAKSDCTIFETVYNGKVGSLR